MPRPLIVLALAVAVWSQATLKYTVPAGWVSLKPSSASRLAEFTLPRDAGDGEDGSVVVYFFGNGVGGTPQANLDRWTGQMTQPDGKPTLDVAKTARFSANGLSFTVVDVPGTYVAEVTPGSTERHNKPGFRLTAAVVETKQGTHYVKAVGPARTMTKWHESVFVFLRSLKIE